MVSIRELADMIETSGPTFVDSCWTRSEQAYCAGSTARLAARWAAKEATMKALGHGIGEVDPVDIEVHAVEGEAPDLRLHGTAAARARKVGVNHLALSLTHEADFALAFVAAFGAASDALDDNILDAMADVAADGRVGIDDNSPPRPVNQEGRTD